MMNVIKTAIITIIISIISGLLVERFKSLAPRILCNIGNGRPMKLGGKKVYAYIVTVSNLSKKIIHELTLNVQSSQSALKIADAKITKGLKFDSSIKDNILDIYIPFLSKDDKFSVTVYVENRNKPVIVMRSPENFKKIDSEEQNGVLSSFLNTPKQVNEPMKKSEVMFPNEKDDYTMVMNKPLGTVKSVNKEDKGVKALSKNKKAIIAGVSLILLIIAGVLVKIYFKGAAAKSQIPTVKADISKQPTDTSSGSANNANKNVGRNTGTKAPTINTTRNTNANTSTGGSTSNTNLKPSSSETNENKDTKASTSGTTGNSDATKSTGGSNENTNTNTSTNQTNGNSGSNTSTNGGNAGANPSTSGTNQSTGK